MCPSQVISHTHVTIQSCVCQAAMFYPVGMVHKGNPSFRLMSEEVIWKNHGVFGEDKAFTSIDSIQLISNLIKDAFFLQPKAENI